MRGSTSQPRWGPRAALIVWAVFAFITWNVVFDRHVYLAAVHFTQQQIERQQRGEPVSSIDMAYRPAVRQAAVDASMWGGSVLLIGVALAMAAGSRTTRR